MVRNGLLIKLSPTPHDQQCALDHLMKID